MTVTVAHHATGVDLTLRIPGLHPVKVRAATLADAVTCVRSILADERWKMLAMLDGISGELDDLCAPRVEGRGACDKRDGRGWQCLRLPLHPGPCKFGSEVGL